MAQLTELSFKLRIILGQGDITSLAAKRRTIFIVMALAMLVLSVPMLIVCQVKLEQGFAVLNFDSFLKLSQSLDEFEAEYVVGLKVFGYFSGTYFLIICFAIFFMFYKLFKLINGEHQLSPSLQH